MFANNHHNDGHIAVWVAAPPGLQATLVNNQPQRYFRPPYVGVGGWIGIELPAVSDEELGAHLLEAWRLIQEKQRSRAVRNVKARLSR
ncbi:MAG TPA: MmcQ/YjbR family DNA-binding protein [Candidatus Angelobacter sp.]